MFVKKRIPLLIAGVAAVATAATVSINALATTTAAAPRPRYGAVVVEAQDPAYQFRAMPSLTYARWRDASGSHQRFVRSFQISPDADIRKYPQASRIQYHAGGSLTSTRNWRPALKAGTTKRLLDSPEVKGGYAKINNNFVARNGALVTIDEQAFKNATLGRHIWRRSSSDGGRSWSSRPATIDMAGATVHPDASGHAFQGVIRLPDSSLVMPFYVTHKRKPKGFSNAGTETYMAAHLLVSRDDGVSWKRHATVFKSDHNNYNESTVVRRSDGRLLMITRYDVISGGKTYSKLAYRVTTQPVGTSAHLAKATWTKLAPVRVPGADNPDVVRGVSPILRVMDRGVLMLVFGRPRNKIAFSYNGGRSWTTAHSFYDNIPTSGCTKGVPRGTNPQTYVPCSDLGSSGYMGVAVTSPRTAYLIGDSCQGGWGCNPKYGRYPKGTTDKLWFTTVRLG
ncbi:MAG: sialidase family protein [Micromonosporaceae bacterium]